MVMKKVVDFEMNRCLGGAKIPTKLSRMQRRVFTGYFDIQTELFAVIYKGSSQPFHCIIGINCT